jgi:hypothetical protein
MYVFGSAISFSVYLLHTTLLWKYFSFVSLSHYDVRKMYTLYTILHKYILKFLACLHTLFHLYNPAHDHSLSLSLYLLPKSVSAFLILHVFIFHVCLIISPSVYVPSITPLYCAWFFILVSIISPLPLHACFTCATLWAKIPLWSYKVYILPSYSILILTVLLCEYAAQDLYLYLCFMYF